MKHTWILAGVVFFLVAFSPALAGAGYPFVSDIPNQYLKMSTSSGVIRFQVSDNTTPADQLMLTYLSDTPTLVPPDDDHIQLGGSGSDRTIVIRPAPGETGMATVTIIVTDSDGDRNRDSFEVEVSK
jgi:hypothetical protein